MALRERCTQERTDARKDKYAFRLTIPLWSGINKNQDVSTGPIACLFARSLAPLTRSLARLLCSLLRSWESEFLMSQNDLALSQSASFQETDSSYRRRRELRCFST